MILGDILLYRDNVLLFTYTLLMLPLLIIHPCYMILTIAILIKN